MNTILLILSISYFVSLILNINSIKAEFTNYVLKRGDKLGVVESLIITLTSNPATLTPIIVYVVIQSIPYAALASMIALLINYIIKHGKLIK